MKLLWFLSIASINLKRASGHPIMAAMASFMVSKISAEIIEKRY
ncbi:MAG: hypothetical protein NUV45_08435 [Tepidanaerobacteraceae bacterium]|jgi:hypothetical protein|nr:hypothetical protein [Tepidanaerobacteraceae bacterium]